MYFTYIHRDRPTQLFVFSLPVDEPNIFARYLCGQRASHVTRRPSSRTAPHTLLRVPHSRQQQRTQRRGPGSIGNAILRQPEEVLYHHHNRCPRRDPDDLRRHQLKCFFREAQWLASSAMQECRDQRGVRDLHSRRAPPLPLRRRRWFHLGQNHTYATEDITMLAAWNAVIGVIVLELGSKGYKKNGHVL